MMYNESSDEADICKRMLPYRAQVTFRLATDTVSVTVRSRRLSFFDKISGFGNKIFSWRFCDDKLVLESIV